MSNEKSNEKLFPCAFARRIRLLTRFKNKTTTKPKRRSLLSLLLCCTLRRAERVHVPTADCRESCNPPASQAITSSTASVQIDNDTNEKKPVTLPPEDDPSAPSTPALDASHALWLLGPVLSEHHGRKCLVLDLDETLVHSSFKMAPNADFVVPVEIDGANHNVFVLKRPGVDLFMKRMGEIYEIVVFTASLSKYADPVLDQFDLHKVVRHRLFRESCFHYKGSYVKDLSQLGRDLDKVIILDNSPVSYLFHTANAVPVSSWFNDPHDSELVDLIPFLEDLAKVQDVTDVLDSTIPGPYSYL